MYISYYNYSFLGIYISYPLFLLTLCTIGFFEGISLFDYF